MKHIKNITRRFEAFTLIELLVVITIILVLAGLTLQNLPAFVAKGQITGVVGGYHNLFLATQTATLDSQAAGGLGAFPGDVGGQAGWQTAIVPDYMPQSAFNTALAVKGQVANTSVKTVGSTNDPSTVFLACAGMASGTPASTPFGKYGGAYCTMSGAAVAVNGTNSNSVALTTNVIWQ